MFFNTFVVEIEGRMGVREGIITRGFVVDIPVVVEGFAISFIHFICI